MGLVVLSYEFILFQIFTIAFVGSMFTIWWSRRKCSDTNLHDHLLVSQPNQKLELDNKFELGVYKKWLIGVRIATAVILSSFFAWKLMEYGPSVYIYYTHESELSQFDIHSQQQVPCYFIFGDSLVDNGNNNFLNTTAKANYAPYGIDYPTGPTGRFSNGRNSADFIAEYLGFEEPIAANAYANGRSILKGVNYGSGSAGIRNETGQQGGERISLDEQLRNHNITVSRIASFLGENTTDYLKTCLYTVGMGNNDYINNYLMPDYYNTSKEYTPTEYAAALVQQYSEQLQTLYNYGARKIAIFGVGLIGCIPFEMVTTGSNTCSDTINTYIGYFDIQLPLLVDILNENFTDAQFTYVNSTHIALTPAPDTGITVTDIPCCIVSKPPGLCIPNKYPCTNRVSYTFFDGFHPAEYYTGLAAKRAYDSATSFDNYPYDINTLVQIQL